MVSIEYAQLPKVDTSTSWIPQIVSTRLTLDEEQPLRLSMCAEPLIMSGSTLQGDGFGDHVSFFCSCLVKPAVYLNLVGRDMLS